MQNSPQFQPLSSLGPCYQLHGDWDLLLYTWGRAPARCTHEAACTHPVKVSKHPRRVRENIFMLNTAHCWAHRGTQPVALLIPQNRFLVSLFLHSCANRSSHAVRCDPAEGTCAMFCSDKPVNLLFAEREVKTIFNFSIV